MECIQEKFSDLPITLVLDNGAYQRCAMIQARAQARGIQLLFLPPYSPNLNRIERLWKFVKAESLSAVYHETCPAFCEVITKLFVDGIHRSGRRSFNTGNRLRDIRYCGLPRNIHLPSCVFLYPRYNIFSSKAIVS
ncbi:MAG: transposase [Firmicutes bacterium]|nr:transposase [Bacillota bacterium]